MDYQYVMDALNAIDLDELPGVEAQNKMCPIEGGAPYRKVPDDHRKAGVLALLYPKQGETYLAFIRRASKHEGDKHAGQIGFPGGQYEAYDESMMHTALREVNEEIGVSSGDIRVITALTELYVYASNFLVSPFLGRIDYTPTFNPQIEEVDEILEIPLTHFQKDIKSKGIFKVRDIMLSDVPYYDLGSDRLWGATAMIMSEIEEILF